VDNEFRPNEADLFSQYYNDLNNLGRRHVNMVLDSLRMSYRVALEHNNQIVADEVYIRIRVINDVFSWVDSTI